MVIFALILPAPLCRAENARPVYEWFYDHGGYQKAIQEQKKMQEPIVLYFHASWCPYCRAFERDVLDAPLVKEYLSDVIKVKIDAEKERELSEEYGIFGFPIIFAVDVKTKAAARLPTNLPPQRFIEECRLAGLKKKT